MSEKIKSKNVLERRVVAGRLEWPLSPRQIWGSWEIFSRLFFRELQVRYRQTLLGFFWAILQPALAMAVFTLTLGRIGRFDSSGIPYSVFALTGIVLWTYFANCVSHGAVTFVENRTLLKQVYFPRGLIPLAVISSKLLDFVIGLGLLVFWTLWVYPMTFRTSWFYIPMIVFIVFVLILGITLFLSALCVKYRDIRYAIPFLTQIWFFATPIVYPVTLAQEQNRWIFFINPMAIAVQGMRDAVFGSQTVSVPMYAILVGISTSSLVVGLWLFRRMERTFSDIV